ncbi:MAG: type IV toxin-antitoxin system AbiEi family antitoxin domain-containing protein [Marmoricola sp.]
MADHLLTSAFPLPLDEPFTVAQAAAAGISRHALARLLGEGFVRRVLVGVYVAAQAPDTPRLRARAARLVVADRYVVTDESAGWIAGARMILGPGAHRSAPPLTVFAADRGYRLRNGMVASGSRDLGSGDVIEIEGVRLTTPLRTALDLGRLRHRDRAIAAIDQLLRLGLFEREHLLFEVGLARGLRGVRQLRWLAPIGDARSESPGESALRLRCHDAGLRPTPQYEIRDPNGRLLGRGDLVVEDLRLLIEYDGAYWHEPERKAHDTSRRHAIEDAGWTVLVLRRGDVFGPRQRAVPLIAEAARTARRNLGDVRLHDLRSA